MPQWIRLPSGRSINFENAREIHVESSSVRWTYSNNAGDREDCTDATAAETVYASILAQIQTGVLSLTSITPNSFAAGGGGTSAVLRGSGFTTDFQGGSFPTITIGAQATAKTFVDDNTIYLTFNTAIGPATVDVTYTSLAGQVLKLVNGYTFT